VFTRYCVECNNEYLISGGGGGIANEEDKDNDHDEGEVLNLVI